MVRLANLVTEIYANGAELLVSRGRLGIRGNPPQFIYNEIEENKDLLLQALTGDPLSGPGWEVRTVLYRQALRWLDERTPEDLKEKVTRALCKENVVEKLNEAWLSGNFEEFRAALKGYIGTGLAVISEAGQREDRKVEMRG
jgi:hypothetical protein